jgi:hypothetical protein
MASDFAVFARAPLTITVAGTTVSVPYRPAAEWAQALDRLSALAALLADPQEREVLVDLVVDDPQAVADLRTESLRILGEATGRKWWEAGRLMATSTSTEVLGRLVLAGVDAHTRSVGEWCAAVYALCVKGQDEKGRLKFDFSLSIPPPGYEDEWDDDGYDVGAAADSVKALMG